MLGDLPLSLFGVFRALLSPPDLQRPPGYADPGGVTGLDGVEAGAIAAPSGLPTGLSPNLLAYVVGPIALVGLIALVHYELVAGQVWIYAAVIIGTALLGLLAERWADAPPDRCASTLASRCTCRR